MTPIDATLLGVAVAGLAASLGFLTYVLSRALLPLTPTAKLWDRMYEADKLAMAYPKVVRLYMEQVDRKSPYFYAPESEVPRIDDYYQLKTFIYFHLNMFEEMFQTTRRSSWVSKQFESEGWDKYIFEKLRHLLMKEVFDRESELLYSGKFREFIQANRTEIDKNPNRIAF